jgi:hypothetical protein
VFGSNPKAYTDAVLMFLDCLMAVAKSEKMSHYYVARQRRYYPRYVAVGPQRIIRYVSADGLLETEMDVVMPEYSFETDLHGTQYKSFEEPELFKTILATQNYVKQERILKWWSDDTEGQRQRALLAVRFAMTIPKRLFVAMTIPKPWSGEKPAYTTPKSHVYSRESMTNRDSNRWLSIVLSNDTCLNCQSQHSKKSTTMS